MAEGAQIAEAFVKIRPNTQGFERDVQQQVTSPLKAAAGIAATAFAAVKVKDFLGGGLDELKEQQQVMAQTAVAIKATGGAAGVSAQHVSDLAQAAQDLSGKDKEAVQAGENLLLQFKNIRNEGAGKDTFDRASQAALDLSVATGTDLTSAYQTVGRALEDPLQGTRALRAANVILTASEKEHIKQLVESGNTAEAQSFILKRLETQVGGAAKAYGETLPGKLERAKNAMDDVKASIVSSAAPALEQIATGATSAAEAFQKLPTPVVSGLLGLTALAAVSGPLGRSFGAVSTGVDALRAGLAENSSQVLRSGAVLAGYGLAIAAVVAYTQHLNEVSRETSTEIFRKLDFTKPTETAKQYAAAVDDIRRRGEELKSLDFTEKVAAGITGQATALRNAAAQADEHLQHILAANKAIDQVAHTLGISGAEVSKAFTDLGIDPAAVSVQRLVAVLQDLRDGHIDAAEAARQLGGDEKTATDAFDDASTAADKLKDQLFGLVDAQHAASDSQDRIADSQRAAERAATRITDAQRGYAKALDAVNEAQYARKQALLGVGDAQNAVRKAQQDLDEARSGPDPRALADKQDALARSYRSIEEAQHGVMKAQQALDDARVKGDPKDIADKEYALAQAHLSVEDAQKGMTKAEQDLNDARAGADPKEIASRQDALAKAQRGVGDAQHQVAQATKSVEDANYQAQKAQQAITDAQYDYFKALKDVERARYDAVKAAEALRVKEKELEDAAAKNAGSMQLVTDQLILWQTQSPEAAAALQEVIDKANALVAIALADKVFSGVGSVISDPAVRKQIEGLAGNPGATAGAARVTAAGLHLPSVEAGGVTINQTNHFDGLAPQQAIDISNQRLVTLAGGFG